VNFHCSKCGEEVGPDELLPDDNGKAVCLTCYVPEEEVRDG